MFFISWWLTLVLEFDGLEVYGIANWNMDAAFTHGVGMSGLFCSGRLFTCICFLTNVQEDHELKWSVKNKISSSIIAVTVIMINKY